MNLFSKLGILGIILSIVGLFSACGAIQRLEKAADDVGAIVKEVRTKTESIDANKDGKWTLEEILVFLGLPVSILGLLTRNFISDKRKAKIEKKVEQISGVQ